ncbi:MAG TPA: hypothetical protein VGY77_03510 [Gemmataceae bacterium]|nr:hypothetical protein [Gemmataceae bacterium]
MRYFILFCLVPAFLLIGPAPLLGQQPPVKIIEGIEIGFPTGGGEAGEFPDEQGRFFISKAGFWTPVYIYVGGGPTGITQGRITVEATDRDDVLNNYSIPLPSGGLQPHEQFLAIAYTKTGTSADEITVKVVADNKERKESKRVQNLYSGESLCLTVGSRMPAFRKLLPTIFPKQNQNVNPNQQEGLRTAFLDDVRRLPNRWFGYAGVDVMILTSGNKNFMTGLLGDDRNRKEALAEWIRRGGRLIVSCGRNQDMVADLFRRSQIPLPVTMTEMPADSVDALLSWGLKNPLRNPIPKDDPDAKPSPVILAKLEPKSGMPFERILPERDDDRTAPLIIRWPYGLGQVTLIAFDVDEAPFVSYPDQKEFWSKLFTKLGFKMAENRPPAGGRSNFGQEEINDVASMMQGNLEHFKEVSVISFGWVALFILVYIIIVGPLDYLFLKKVVKRMELTWITFPAVVLVVSVAAYFTAYSLKGNDLRINKLDLIDIDLANKQCYGTSWFTLFSPRIQLYTVGLEPGSPLWTQEQPAPISKAIPTVVSWEGKPDMGWGGYNRPHSQSLFRRSYDYEPDAAGLRGVPIQVWSSKSFSANWESGFQASQPLPKLRRNDKGSLEGTITNPLPVILEDAALIYKEGERNIQVFPLGTLGPAQTSPIISDQARQNLGQWLDPLPTVSGDNYRPSTPTVASLSLIKRILFFELGAGNQGEVRNHALRHLDQSWRLNKHEAILFARVPHKEGQAETVTRASESPSRLWLGEIPAPGKQRPNLAGMLAQDTYVRIYIPVAIPDLK